MSTHTPDDRLAQLSPAKRALLERWRASHSSASTTPGPQPRVAGQSPAPLSFAQQRLWFLEQLAPGQPQYNVAAAVQLRGPLVPALLDESIHSIIARHDALRTSFRAIEGKPRQHVAEQVDWSLQHVAVDGIKATQISDKIDQLAQSESLRPFDLQRAPLLRATLIATPDPREHVLLLTLHHIICDGWSLAVMRRELTEVYAALSAGRAPQLAPLPLRYTDYAVWQREQLQGAKLDSLLEYWSEQLHPLPAPLELPLDHPRPATQTFRGDVRRLRLDATHTFALRQLASQEQATLFMVLLAAWQTLLGRHARQHDICIGIPIANRRHVQLESLIGFFVNTLVIRGSLAANPSARDLIAQVRRTTLDAYAHQDLPFEQLVDRVQPPRDLSRTPLFQAMFVLQNIPLRTSQAGELTVADVRFDHAPISNFDLTLNVDEQRDRLDLSLIYNPDLFEGSTIERLLAAYNRLLDAFVATPDQPVLQIPLLSHDETQLQLIEWNATHRPLPDQRIEQRIAEQARRTPQAIALSAAAETLSYDELDKQANRLAHSLLRQGIARHPAIGVCLPRGPQMIISLLAILKAGGYYVPLDPDYPSTRLDYMVRDADLKLILTTSQLAAQLSSNVCPLLAWQELERELERAADSPPSVRSSLDDLAYIIYTSGSTGQPKGVELTQRGLLNHALALAPAMQLHEGDGLLQYLSLSFDAAAEEIFPTLISGATLHLHAQPSELVGRDLLDYTRERHITVLHLTPPVWLRCWQPPNWKALPR